MAGASVPLRKTWTALAASAIALAVDVVYLIVLQSEGEGDFHRARVQLIAASLAASSAVALGAWSVREPRARVALLAAASFTLLAWGVLGMFSIGLPLFVAGLLLLVSTSHAADELRTSEAFVITAAAGVSALVLAGAVLTTTA
jgi:hypothetical protein